MPRKDTPPPGSLIGAYIAPCDYVDCYSISLDGRPDLQNCAPYAFAEHFGTVEFGWSNALIALRDALVAPLGLKTTGQLRAEGGGKAPHEKGPGDRVNFFRLYALEADEVLLGEDDRHQDFRLSVHRTRGAAAKVVMTTCCKRHNGFGYVYLALILPIHKQLVKATLKKAIALPLRMPET
ncbi:DUF2867 domain-containing protein [Maricaulis sp.]|uniref:DUF2867 domain-containing protein n=1 Tax=Maricaulis sp. TaxID=1486257 RepID=UPI002610644B|nr:DUF2867 domain-containing protein [Maricaulis sp.]